MKTIERFFALAAVMAGGWMTVAAADEASTPAAAQALGVARLTTDGKLEKPTDLERWVFLGASLGMGYNPGSFNAARPGQFQVSSWNRRPSSIFSSTVVMRRARC